LASIFSRLMSGFRYYQQILYALRDENVSTFAAFFLIEDHSRYAEVLSVELSFRLLKAIKQAESLTVLVSPPG
jgi:hypothetical protein